ncbi:methionine ABC transporter ATP-binding protein [Clostridium botulinum]|uniref:Methionine ABC transporter, MUT family, ATP-binding protein n=1 Tax=Clostridium botulinum (strain Okra / Type B1) TaxID=498213 RepID=B1IKV2_CLOBK|nr:methionine ABC transporter ATP-binding protein [Clostridium botulinum]EKX79422.1 methionine ABC transporter ATP-binding protein [Clostridium botulinum CFSAN001628]ACA44410.1 methionine ABC transporter, MUT family, ATP-binding protein [Clostridium botulinum B1 str. Okra]MBD5564376.1 methionine ABC transporter ATP-binding protein [Clostridium botulinum]MBD5566000.1 methionine ABC transporter ATP-binding protein [Clostridium botulinum]MBD5569484.1 methionine ABC transporter ATP-binding protein
MIEISNLQKFYGGTKVLRDINVEIDKGYIYGLLGVSGAGKSTLLRCINGLESYEVGSLKVNDVEVKNLNEKELRAFRKNIGMIFQQFSLLERKTVYENVALPMECWGYKKQDIDKKVKELLELVELGDKIKSKPKELSGGQKQRVAIARALTLDPQILLCDEATSALDPSITNSILELLKKINRELGITIVVVTHQMNVVKQVCNKMAILSKGNLEAKGKVEDIFLDKPKVLEELLGELEDNVIPKQGVNIEIIERENIQKSSLLSSLAIDTKVKYSLVWGGTDKYRDKILGAFVINIKEDDKLKITNYLNEKHIEWREV